MELYTWFRSVASWRVRIALSLKGLDYTARPVDLRAGEGAQHSPGYRAVNAMAMIPALAVDGHVVTQSQAIVELLEELHPEPPLLPADPWKRAYVREAMALLATDLHPLITPRINRYLSQMGTGPEMWLTWVRHWTATGLEGFEALLAASGLAGRFCLGDEPGLADAFLVPQVATALRFDCPVERMPRLMAIHAACSALPAFQRAAPEAQPDAVADG